jgi:hypothetical protein
VGNVVNAKPLLNFCQGSLGAANSRGSKPDIGVGGGWVTKEDPPLPVICGARKIVQLMERLAEKGLNIRGLIARARSYEL